MNLSTARSYKRFGWAPSPGIGKIQWADPALWCVTILGCLSVCFAILLYCQNIFFQDEWALFTIFEKYGAKPDFWRPANEHRIVLTRLIYFGLMKMGHLDVRYVMIISQCLLWATMIPLSSAINVFGWKRWALFLIIGFMYASPAHVENQLWGFQISMVFCVFQCYSFSLFFNQAIISAIRLYHRASCYVAGFPGDINMAGGHVECRNSYRNQNIKRYFKNKMASLMGGNFCD